MGPVQLRRIEDLVVRRTRGEASDMLAGSPASEDQGVGRVTVEEGPVVELAAYPAAIDVGNAVDHRVGSRRALTWDCLHWSVEDGRGERGWSSLDFDGRTDDVRGWNNLGSSEWDWDGWMEGGMVAHTGNVRPTLAPATMTMGPRVARIDVAPSGCVAGQRRRAL